MAGSTQTVAFSGGSLVLDGMASGITVSRDINVQGLGANSRSGAILSSGDNTLSGLVATAGGATARATRIISQAGTLNFSGNLNVGSAFNTIVTSLGGTNQTGSGSYTITGALSGTGILEKTGSGTLLLEPASTAGFGGRVRIGSSATGQQSTVRVTTSTVGGVSVFGTSTAATNQAPVHFTTNGILEIRNDGSLAFGKNVYVQNSSTIFVGLVLAVQG